MIDPLVQVGLDRIEAAHPHVKEWRADDEGFQAALMAVVEASRSLTRALETDAAAVEVLRGDLSQPRPLDDPADLRRWKRRELLRIAARDLTGQADLATVTAELSQLAASCLEAALALTEGAEPTTAVVGMGKLGGEELNYASDVDVLFVHDGPSAAGEERARQVLRIMAAPTADGIVFRTDADLRPEGRAGPLSRDLGSYGAYYERWASAWEFQALLKARAVAGDAGLGTAFSTMAERFVWGDRLGPDGIREIRALKARAEEELRRTGLESREIKRGPGGIRDVEFSVQLLQLVHGRHDPGLRVRGTLPALQSLAAHGYVDEVDVARLDDAYRWLRTVEHRLQLVDERQVYALPADPEALRLLARVLGFRDEPGASAVEQFEDHHRRHQAVVRAIHERLYFRPLLEAFAGAGPLGPEAVEERLAAFGFHEAAQIRGALKELTEGFSRQSRLMEQLFPLILDWLSASPGPDLGLLQLRTLAEGPARAGVLATAFRESPGAAERTCRLLGSSRVIGQALRRNPEFVHALGDDAVLDHEKTAEEMAGEARQTLAWRGDFDEHREGIRRYKRRELLRIAARDLLGFAGTAAVGRELTALADATIDASVRAVEPRVPFAVVGLGRLGGRGLSYASDVDVLFVYDGEGAADQAAAERAAEDLIRFVGTATAEGEAFEVDARLRPEGASGPLARSMESYRQYYERWGQTWERQALTTARFVAGDPVVGHRFLAMIDDLLYGAPLSEEGVREIRRMKARVESERIPPGDDPEFHLKLGRGSLSDVEFTVQLLKLLHGAEHTIVRDVSTLGALDKLVQVGAVDAEDAEAMADAYRFCERARNHRFLHLGRGGDSLPADPAEAAHLARMLGYASRPVLAMRDDYRRLTRRCRRVVERVFYGRA